MKLLRNTAAGVCLLLLLASPCPAKEINWGGVPAANITLFYPGVASWEFLLSDDHRLGAHEIKQGRKDCRHCHLSREGELDLKADEIAAGAVRMKRSHNPFEPEPITGKKGTISARVQAAYDNENIYIRVEWESKGSGWHKKPGGLPDRVSLQLNRSETTFKKYGCFIGCHNDLNTMPASPSKKEVKANAYYKALDRDDVRLYAFYTRSSWSSRLGQKELEKKLKGGGRIDLWSLELDNGTATPFSGWIFDDRRWDDKPAIDGSALWSGNRYTAVFKRSRLTKGDLDIQVKEGEVLTTGLAIHDDGVEKRRHYVSFPFTIGIGKNAGASDITASKFPD